MDDTGGAFAEPAECSPVSEGRASASAEQGLGRGAHTAPGGQLRVPGELGRHLSEEVATRLVGRN